MKLEIIKSEKNYAEFVIEGEKHSFPNMLKQKLLEMKDVEFVSYILEHPMDTGAKFVIRTRGKSPKKVLEAAAKALDKDLDDFDKKVKSVLK